MGIRAVTGKRLHRMSQRMPIVQALAHATAFRLVLRDDVGLEHDGARDGLGGHIVIARRERGGVVAQPEEKLVGVDHRRLCDFPAAACPFARGQRGEHLSRGAHVRRLREGAYEVLTCGKVHARFAADRGVDHGEQRGGRLHHGDAAHERGRGEPSKIAHHPAAERHDSAVAAELQARHRFPNLACNLDGLRFLSRGDDDFAHAVIRSTKRRLRLLEIQRGHVGVGDDQDARRIHRGVDAAQVVSQPVEHVGTDAHIVGPLTGDVHNHFRRWHNTPSFSSAR